MKVRIRTSPAVVLSAAVLQVFFAGCTQREIVSERPRSLSPSSSYSYRENSLRSAPAQKKPQPKPEMKKKPEKAEYIEYFGVSRAGDKNLIGFETEPGVVYMLFYQDFGQPWRELPQARYVRGTGRTVTVEDRVPEQAGRRYMIKIKYRP